MRRRGFHSGLCFLDRRKVEAERYRQYQATGGQSFAGNELIKNPLRRKKQLPLRGRTTTQSFLKKM